MKKLGWIFLCWIGTLCSVSAEEFIRIRDGKWGIKHLDIAVKSYQMPGPAHATIQLVGVSHIGTGSYYQEIQQVLEAADVVLFEGVDGHREEFREMKPDDEASKKNLQVTLANSLGLKFQLHAIDYSPKHFQNSDVSTVQLRELMRGNEIDLEDPGSPEEMEKLLDQMRTENMSGQLVQSALTALDTHPKWRRAMKWCMVMILGSLQGDVSEYAGLPPKLKDFMKVLILKRNEVVLHDIRKTLDDIGEGQTIAVFYGAAHMADFEKKLVQDFGAKVGETTWLTAFSGNLKTSGLNIVEKSMVNSFMAQQLAAIEIMSSTAEE